MAVTVVNGYLCTTCSEAAKARSGQNPQSPTDQAPNAQSDPTQTPAVVFGGSLGGQNAVVPAGSANGSASAALDIRA